MKNGGTEMADQKLNLNINLGEIHYIDIFAVAYAKTRDAKIPLNFDRVKLQNFYGNVALLFSTQFNLKLVIEIFQ